MSMKLPVKENNIQVQEIYPEAVLCMTQTGKRKIEMFFYITDKYFVSKELIYNLYHLIN